MKRSILICTFSIIFFASTANAGIVFSAPGASGGVVEVVEGDTLTIDIVSNANEIYCAYLDCDGAIITVPIARPAAGTTSIIPDPDPNYCGYDLCTLDPFTAVPGIHFTFTLITNLGDAGQSYPLTLYDETITIVLDTLTVNVITALDCMQVLEVDIDDPCTYAMFLKADSPACWCDEYNCQGDADGLFVGPDVDGKRKWVTLADLNILSNCWGRKECELPPECICADCDRSFAGMDTDCNRRWIRLPDLNIFSASWGLKESRMPTGPHKVPCHGYE